MQLAVTGQGQYGMSYVGQLKQFQEKKFIPEKYVGCSMGQIIGQLWQSDVEYSKIPDIFTKMKTSYNELMELLFSVWDIVTQWGIISTDNMENVLKQYIPQKWDDLKFPFYCIATDVSSHGIRIFGKEYTPDIPVYKAIVASQTTAPLMIPTKLKINNKIHYFIDGGFMDITPIRYLDKDTDRLVIQPWKVGEVNKDVNIEKQSGYSEINNLIDYFINIYDSMNKENTLDDLINEKFESLSTGMYKIKNAFDFTYWKENIDLGYKNTMEFLSKR